MSLVESNLNDRHCLPTEPLRLSVVIPVRDEEAYIGRTLQMLLEQEYPRDYCEILVVDGQSTDRTREIVREYQREGAPIRLLQNPDRWSSAARNIGVRAAVGDVILVIDGHCELPDRFHFQAVVEAFQRSGADVLGRPQPLTVANLSPLQQAISAARASRLGHHPDSFIYSSRDQFVPAASVGAAYRSDVFHRIGLFDERFDACEDVDFNYRADRAGLTCFLASRAEVKYYPRETLRGLFWQLARYGRGRVRLARKHGQILSWKTAAPAVFLAVLTIVLGMAAFLPWALAVFVSLLTTYFVVTAGVSLSLAVQHGVGWAAWRLPAVFAAIHLGAGLGVLHEWLCGRRDMRGELSV